jgi:hypothetical protein
LLVFFFFFFLPGWILVFRELLENRSFSDGAGGVMCPLRVILLFLSALLAGYFALKTFRNEEGSSNGFLDMKNEDRQPDASAKVLLEEQGNVFHKAYSRFVSGVLLLVDMLSGRYLWQNLQLQNKGIKMG